MTLLSSLGLSAEAKILRRDALGGSDANVIMSGDEKRLLKLWREKRGEIEGEDLSDILAVQMGSFTEPFNVAWFEKHTGLRVTCQGMAIPASRSKAEPFMACTLDGLVAETWAEGDVINGQELGVFEAKHCGTRNTDAELFARYVPQLTHNCLVVGESRAWLSCFKGNGDWVMMEYALDETYAERLVAAEAAFWECVRTGAPPCPVEPEPTPKPVGIVEYSMQGNNEWASHCADYIETELAADRHEIAKKSLKALMPDDASKCFGYGLELRRDKRGAVRFYRDVAE